MNILGTEYKIVTKNVNTDPALQGLGGYCDFEKKEIVINEECELEDVTTRHEIIHAFLYESGLNSCSWGRNEEMVDWIAIQLPKIMDICDEYDLC